MPTYVRIQSTEELDRGLEVIWGFYLVSLPLPLGTKPGEDVLRKGIGRDTLGRCQPKCVGVT